MMMGEEKEHSLSEGQIKLLMVGAGVLVGLGVVSGASIWGGLYYLVFVIMALWFLRQFRREIGSQEKGWFAKGGFRGLLRVVANSLGRMEAVVRSVIGSMSMESRQVEGEELYQKGFLRLWILTTVVTHLYAIAISLLDKYAPGLAQSWYTLAQPLVDVQIQYSYGYDKLSSVLFKYGYSNRIDFITHLYVAPIIISFMCAFISPLKLVKMFRLEVKAHIFYLIRIKGRREILTSPSRFLYKQAMFVTLVGVPMILVFTYWWLLGAAPIDLISYPRNPVFLLTAYKSRVDMFVFAALIPMVFLLNFWLLKALIAYGVVAVRLLRRKRFFSPQR